MNSTLAAITGASSGIGAVFARKLAARGYHLLLIARRRDRLESLAAELSRTHSIQAEVMEADLSETGGLERVAARLAAEERLTLLVNNAGFGTKGFFWERPVEEQSLMHRLHVGATLRLSHAVLPGMVRRNAGAVINVASVAGFIRGPENVSYCATKSWMNAFTEGLYLELKRIRSKVVVQSLCPGFTYTEFHDVMGVEQKTIPKWLWMSADDVVEESLAAIGRRKLFVIPGRKYKVIVAVLSKLPIWLRLRLESGSPRGKKR
jgi:short-subunit dehydrogenase